MSVHKVKKTTTKLLTKSAKDFDIAKSQGFNMTELLKYDHMEENILFDHMEENMLFDHMEENILFDHMEENILFDDDVMRKPNQIKI